MTTEKSTAKKGSGTFADASFFSVEETAERFMRYAAIPTQSEEGHTKTPSTKRQRALASVLTKDLTEMGAAEVYYDETYCYVYATIPGNLPLTEAEQKQLDAREDKKTKRRENLAPILGLMAHMDTSDAVKNPVVHPRRIDNYDGGSLLLNEEAQVVLDPAAYPDLTRMVGKTLVVTDGTSVLGGDDKAGICAIMELARFYLSHPQYPHGTIRLCFTPDEEVGNGTAYLDREHFAVDYAYTVDGSDPSALEYESFNAATAQLSFHGVSTHPGSACGRMKNALLMAHEYQSALPAEEIPAKTKDREGFYHLIRAEGTPEQAELEYLIRDHDKASFAARKEQMAQAARAVEAVYGEGTVSLLVEDSYYNMAEKILPHRHLIDNALAAIRAEGIEPKTLPIRGGTDGCRLSFLGIPCPNLGTGGYAFHSIYEFVCVEEMIQCIHILLRIMENYAAYRLDD